jgi:hypothetical protein
MPVINSDTNNTNISQDKLILINEQALEVKPLTDYPRLEINGVFLRLIAPNTYFIEGKY